MLLPSLIALSDNDENTYKKWFKKCIIESVDNIILWAPFSLEARNYKYLAIRDLLGEEIITLKNSELLEEERGLIFRTALCVIESEEWMAILPWARISVGMPLPAPSSPALTSWIPIVEPVNVIEQTCMQITIASTHVHYSE